MKHVLLAFALALLAGCALFQPKPAPPVVVTKLVPYECGTPPAADPYTALPVQWTVVQQASGPVFALSVPMYEALQTNLAHLLTSGQQVRDQRDFYAECVARARKAADSAPGPPATKPAAAAP